MRAQSYQNLRQLQLSYNMTHSVHARQEVGEIHNALALEARCAEAVTCQRRAGGDGRWVRIEWRSGSGPLAQGRTVALAQRRQAPGSRFALHRPRQAAWASPLHLPGSHAMRPLQPAALDWLSQHDVQHPAAKANLKEILVGPASDII